MPNIVCGIPISISSESENTAAKQIKCIQSATGKLNICWFLFSLKNEGLA